MTNIDNKILDLSSKSQIDIIDMNEFYLLYEIENIVKKLPDRNNDSFIKSIKDKIYQEKRINHNIELPRTPLYALPNTTAADLTADSVKWKMPTQVDLTYPVESTTNFSLEIDDYETKNLYGALTGIHQNDVDITINDSDGSQIVKFDLTKSRLISESFETSVDGAVVVNLTYKKYSNKR